MEGGRNPFGFGGPFGGFGGPFGPGGSFGGPFSPGSGFRGPFGDPGVGFGGPFGGPGVGFGGPGVGFGGPFGGPGVGFGRTGPSLFEGGMDPFGDPYFRPPFGSMFEPNFSGPVGGPFMNPHAPGFLEHQPSQPNTSRGPIIEELSSDDENDEKEIGNEKNDNPRKHSRSDKEPLVEYPDIETAEKKIKHIPYRNEMHQMQKGGSQPQSHSFTFQSSTVSYGGANGTCYTSSRTRKMGSDGLIFEECKEADSSTRQAAHRISRALHDKGHSVTRKLKSGGHVDTMQTLHNLNEDELVGFEEAWNGNAKKHLPGWREGFANQEVMDGEIELEQLLAFLEHSANGSGSSSENRPNRGGWALPSSERSNEAGPSSRHNPGRRMNPDVRGSGPTRHIMGP